VRDAGIEVDLGTSCGHAANAKPPTAVFAGAHNISDAGSLLGGETIGEGLP